MNSKHPLFFFFLSSISISINTRLDCHYQLMVIQSVWNAFPPQVARHRFKVRAGFAADLTQQAEGKVKRALKEPKNCLCQFQVHKIFTWHYHVTTSIKNTMNTRTLRVNTTCSLWLAAHVYFFSLQTKQIHFCKAACSTFSLTSLLPSLPHTHYILASFCLMQTQQIKTRSR